MGKRTKPAAVESDPVLAEVRRLAREAGPDAIRALIAIMGAADSASASLRLAAIKELLDRGFGRAAAAPNESTAAATEHLLVDDGYAN